MQLNPSRLRKNCIQTVIDMTYTITISQERPSEHKLTVHRETLTCPHAREHVDLVIHLLDVIGYDCGVRQSEFKELAGRVERIKELIVQLRDMPRRKTPPEVGMTP